MNLRRLRKKKGISLVEMLSTIFIMAFVGAAITEICVTQNAVAFRTYNKIEALTNGRRVASAVERDVHNALQIGDRQGITKYTFPSGGISNPYSTTGPSVGSGITQFFGFPGATSNTNWPPPPYSLDPQTLILQVPILTSDSIPGSTTNDFFGFPTKNSFGSDWNVDTYVYKVLADTSRPGTGQFVLQKAVFPGVNSTSQILSNNPETLLTGIIGPIDPTQAPDPTAGTPAPLVFQFISKSHPLFLGNGSSNAFVIPSSTQPETVDLAGIVCTFEIYSDADSKRKDYVPRSFAVRNEMYLRGNYVSPWSFGN